MSELYLDEVAVPALVLGYKGYRGYKVTRVIRVIRVWDLGFRV